MKCVIQVVTAARDIGSCLFHGTRVDDPWFKPKTTYRVLLIILGEELTAESVVTVTEFNDRPSMLLRCEDLIKLMIRSLFSEHMCKFYERNTLYGRVILTALVLAVLLSKPVEGKNATGRGVVRLAVIAPADREHEQSLYRVLPAVDLAIRKVSDPFTGSLPAWDIRVDHRDSRCSSTYGPLAAFEFYINRSAGIAGGPWRHTAHTWRFLTCYSRN
jgi:hypothetical protein